MNNNGGDNFNRPSNRLATRTCEDEVAARNKSDLYSELLPAMSVEACQTAKKGDVPALKTLLTNPATRAAIDQRFEVPGYLGVSILKLLVVLLAPSPSPSLLLLSTAACLCAVHAWMRIVGVCVLHVSGSMCACAYDTCAHMLAVGVSRFFKFVKNKIL